jgi:hypothetical protein
MLLVLADRLCPRRVPSQLPQRDVHLAEAKTTMDQEVTMSERIYIPPRRRRQLPIGPYDIERKARGVVIAVLATLAVGILIWAVRTH